MAGERNETERALDLTNQLLERAAEIDPAAWAAPLPDRMNARRNRSYAKAVAELKAQAAAGGRRQRG